MRLKLSIHILLIFSCFLLQIGTTVALPQSLKEINKKTNNAIVSDDAFIEQVAERHSSLESEVQWSQVEPSSYLVTGHAIDEAFGNKFDIAVITQIGYGNNATIEQQGLDNRAGIYQTGDSNIGFIQQDGEANTALMNIFGSGNDISVLQLGNNNLFNLDLNGDDNFLKLTQDGDNNRYERVKEGDAILDETITQSGNDNNAMQVGSLNGGRSANIIQEGNGMDLIIRHNN